ncbi:hypothetical protein BDL97_06G039900 [Sphagnum fallax]|nr:hypothetical protein BDL97_06G039900 [Sphagnum fallax]
MATLLMRTPELATAEKLSINCIEHTTRLQTDKVIQVDHEGPSHKTTAVEGRSSRARKGKSGQKKQPQRGLGVAQLEKLRLQEQQSKQETASLESLQSSLPAPFASSADHHQGSSGVVGLRCVSRGGGPLPALTTPHHHHHQGSSSTIALSPCSNARLGPPDKRSDFLAGEYHHHHHSLARTSSEKDALKTIMSLARDPSNSNAATTARHAQGSRTSSYEDNPDRIASSYAVACLGSPTTHAKTTAPMFLNVQTSRVSNVVVNLKEEKRTVEDVDDKVIESACLLPVTSGFLEPGVLQSGGSRTLLQLVPKDAGDGISTLTNLHCFESPLGSGNVGASNIDRPRELSSFQSFSSNPILPSIEKTCGQKRPWYSLKESLSKQLCSKSLDLNVPAGENNAGNEGCTPNVVQSPESPRGANYTTGIFRSALGNSLPLLKLKAHSALSTWQETDLPIFRAVQSEVGLVKDSHPSAHHSSALTLNRRRCLSRSEVPALMGVDLQLSGDFLTLGLPSCSYPVKSECKLEVNGRDVHDMDEFSTVKQIAIFSEGDEEKLQLQMCNTHQIIGPELVSFSEILYLDGKPMMKELEKVLLPRMLVVGLQVRVWASPCLLSAFLSVS